MVLSRIGNKIHCLYFLFAMFLWITVACIRKLWIVSYNNSKQLLHESDFVRNIKSMQ